MIPRRKLPVLKDALAIGLKDMAAELAAL